MEKKILTILGVILLFALVYVAGHYRLLPTHYIRIALDQVKVQFGTQQEYVPRSTDAVEFLDTHLTRLLIKKVPLKEYDGSGGGISVSGDYIFISSNKGDISIYNAESIKKVETSINSVPMNLEALIEAGHTKRNSFRYWWFRVNGFYVEKSDSQNYQLYTSHNYYDFENDCISHRVSKTELLVQNGTLIQNGEWDSLFSAEPCFDPEPEGYVSAVPYSGHISGGAIQPLDDDNILITVGDYNHHGLGEMPNFSQDPETGYGKFIRLNKLNGSHSVFANGTRNPSGLFVGDNVIWSVENGPEGGDELNIIEEGKNYGWPEVSYGIWYTPGYTFSDDIETGRHTGYQIPVYSWIPAIAPSSIIQLHSERFPLWDGDLIVGAMRGQGLRRLRLNPENGIVYDEEIYLGHRIRGMAVLKNEQIALLTDDSYLIILDNGGPVFEDWPPYIDERIAELERFDQMFDENNRLNESRTASMIFEQRCGTCHTLNETSEIGPHLAGLLGRQVGAASDFSYSNVFQEDDREWDSDLLRQFLTNPESGFSGNRMNKIELAGAEVDSIIHFFENPQGRQGNKR